MLPPWRSEAAVLRFETLPATPRSIGGLFPGEESHLPKERWLLREPILSDPELLLEGPECGGLARAGASGQDDFSDFVSGCRHDKPPPFLNNYCLLDN